MDTPIVWKDVLGYEGLYQVNNLGQVKSLVKYKGSSSRILSPGIGSSGYQVVVLCKNKRKKSHTVHRIVANAFLPNPNNYPCINHKDEDKSNNNVSNLEWCTYSYNGAYGIRGEILKKQRKAVAQCGLNGMIIATFASRCEAARSVGGNASNIASVINGKKKTYRGFIWKELNNDAS